MLCVGGRTLPPTDMPAGYLPPIECPPAQFRGPPALAPPANRFGEPSAALGELFSLSRVRGDSKFKPL